MPVRFRNVDASPSDDVRTWPYEALVICIDRGLVPDWRPIFAEIRRAPWGRLARRVERILDSREYDGATALFRLAIDRARERQDRADRDEVAARVRNAVARSGLTSARFAERIGTSASRLSTYMGGTVTPSAALLLRIERCASGDQVESE
jgi:hypothetical protein